MRRAWGRVRVIAGALVALGVLAAACGSDEPTDATSQTGAVVTEPVPASIGSVPQLSPVEGAALLAEQGDAVTVIDVRTPDEFATARLENAININVEAADFDDRVGELDPARSYAVYCRSGRRSAVAAARMVELGFTDVHDLGGIEDWTASGNPIVEG